MTTGPGTPDLLARELGAALTALPGLLDGGPGGLLAELGLRPPTTVLDDPALLDATNALTAAVEPLPDQVAALSEAIALGDPAAVVAASSALIPSIVAVTTNLGALASALSSSAASVTAPPSAGTWLELAEALPRRILELLVVDHLATQRPRLFAWLELLGIAERVAVDGGDQTDTPPYLRRTVRLDRAATLLTDPDAYARERFGWGNDDFDGITLLTALHRLLVDHLEIDAILLLPEDDLGVLEAFIVGLAVDDTSQPPSLVASLRVPVSGQVQQHVPLEEPWSAVVSASGTVGADLQARVLPPLSLEIEAPEAAADLSLRIELRAERPDRDLVVLGHADGTRVQAGRVVAALQIAGSWSHDDEGVVLRPRVEFGLEQGRVILGLGDADGFLASVLPAELVVDLDLDATWDESGLRVTGGAGTRLELPLHLQLGPVSLQRLALSLSVSDTGLRIEARATAALDLGPMQAVVDGVGAATQLAIRDAEMAPIDASARFLAPSGLGLHIDAGAVRGGGFIAHDEQTGRYTGVLQVSVADVGVTALGLLDTQLPDDQPGYALLLVLRGQFPAIQVGFGFALTAIGGLLAVNRRVDVDELRERFATGTVGSILAPEDPIADAAQLLAELGEVFPAAPGSVVVGPTVQLRWAELVRFDLGLFLELPTARVLLLGSARAAIDNPAGSRPLLQVRVDVLGFLDVPGRRLEFDAVLVDSHLLEVLELTGGAAFRMSWGAEPYVVLSVGGFHPRYEPAPLAFPASLTRVAASYRDPGAVVSLRLEGYLAVTTNSLQFGGAVEARIVSGQLTALGLLQLDTLITFVPFAFEIDFRASFEVRYRQVTLAGIEVTGSLAGPGPLTFSGSLTIRVLLLELSWSTTVTFGTATEPALPTVASALDALVEELEHPANLSVSGGEDRFVQLDLTDGSPGPGLLAPGGELRWSQTRAPLDVVLERFERHPLLMPERIVASGPDVTGTTWEHLAPGSFVDLDDSEVLQRPAFEHLDAGVVLGVEGTRDGRNERLPVEIETIRLPGHEGVEAAGSELPEHVLRATDRRLGARPSPGEPMIVVDAVPWAVVGAAGDVQATTTSATQAHQTARHTPGRSVAVAATDLLATPTF